MAAYVITLLLMLPGIYALFALIFGWARLRYTDAGVVKSLSELPRKKVKRTINGVEKHVEVADLLVCGRGPGGFVLLLPMIDQLRAYPVLEDVRDYAEVRNVLTAEPSPVNMSLAIEVIYRYVDIGQAAISVPDGDPINEARRIAVESLVSAIQSHTIQEHVQRGAVDRLRAEILSKLQDNKILESWGITVRGVVISSYDFDEDYKVAQEDIIRQQARAEQMLIEARAEAEKDRILAEENKTRIELLGIDYVMYIERLQNELRTMEALSKSGAIPTVIHAGGGVTQAQVSPERIAEIQAALDNQKNKGGRK